MNIFYVVIFSLFKYFVNCDINITDSLLNTLPPIFQIDDHDLCKKENKMFCRSSVLLQPRNFTNKSVYWDLIEGTVKHPKYYNHNELFHAICVEDFCSNEILERQYLDLKLQITDCYNLKYNYLGLNCVITELICEEPDNHHNIRIIDVFILLLLLMYIFFVLFATYRDYQLQKTNKKLKCFVHLEETKMSAFSLIANWKKLCLLNDRPDFQKLNFIQGIRFYNMLLIIMCHTVCSYIGGYVKNTEYFELIYRHGVRQSITTLFVFLVQTFFLLSAFLLSYHVSQTMEKYKDSKIRFIFLTFLNRYLRILPPVLVAIMCICTVWITPIFDGPLQNIYSGMEFERCRKNWWTNVFFINNHHNESEMCYFLTWYLAADTQLYLVSLIILFIIWKYRHKTKTILATSVLVGILLPTILCYKYDLDLIYRLTPENTKNNNFRSFKFNAVYTSTYANMASYMIGLCLGCCYFAIEKKKIRIQYHSFIWMSIFITLPTAVVYISSYDYSPFVTVLLSGLVKPCYALGIGIGILGMSQHENSILRKVCEWRPVLFLGNFTYSTYVIQYGIVFFRTAVAKQPLYVSDYVLGISFVKDATLSIFFGFLLHIFVEMPSLQIQKMYIPQVRNIGKEKSSTKEN